MRIVFTLAGLLVLALPLAAQDSNPFLLEPGDRIRVDAPGPTTERVDARVTTVGPTSFDFTLEDDPGQLFTRAFNNVDTLDVRHRSRSYSARGGALWGLYLGAAAGLIAGPFYAANGAMDTGPAVGLFGGVGGIVGALTGAALGALIAPERWYRYVVE